MAALIMSSILSSLSDSSTSSILTNFLIGSGSLLIVFSLLSTSFNSSFVGSTKFFAFGANPCATLF